jgi:hypothetical protein
MKRGRREERLMEKSDRKECNREEWKKLLRTARNHHVLHMPVVSMKLHKFSFL